MPTQRAMGGLVAKPWKEEIHTPLISCWCLAFTSRSCIKKVQAQKYGLAWIGQKLVKSKHNTQKKKKGLIS